MFVQQWLEAHSRIRPDKLALVDRETGVRMDYAELRRAAVARAAQLHGLGVRPGDRVAVLSVNRAETIDLFFACARLGAILVPLNFRLSDREQEQILADCSPRVLFLEPGRPAPAPCGAMVLPLKPAPRGAEEPPAAELPEDAPLLILYTGGTTGTPKGAVLTHRSLQWNAWNTIAGWGLSPDDVAPVFTPLFHTGGWNVLATPLWCLGATVVLAPAFEPECALCTLEEERCTLLFLVPTMFQMLLRHERFSRYRMASLRALISGGAPCPEPLMEEYRAYGLPLTQGYGLTEAGPNTFGVSYEDAATRPATVGFPLPHVRLRLVRADGAEAGPGEVGELYVAGPHVMAGYWNRPEATQAVLKDGWLRTGDLAIRDEEGFHTICGRSKEMYISGGENVFPSEVESVLLGHPEVAEAAVVGVPDPKWGEVGRAYLVLRNGTPVAPEEIIEHCRRHLARYKAPKEVRFVPALPKSPAGKILKRELLAEPALA